MRNRIKVLPVDGYPVVLEGLRSCLARNARFKVVGAACSADEALSKAGKLAPDVVLMGAATSGTNGVEATIKLRQACPGAKVLMFVEKEEKEAVQQMIQAGARGCIQKTASTSELTMALEKVHDGETFFSPSVAQMFFDDFVTRGGKPQEPVDKSISEREQQVLRLVVDGAANKNIAASLNISIRTVEKHRQRIMKKLNVHKATDLVRFAISRRLVEVDLSAPRAL